MHTEYCAFRLPGVFLSTDVIYHYLFFISADSLLLLLLLLLSSSSSSPETNYVPREYSVAAVLLLLYMVLILLVSVLNPLYFYISTFRSVCAVPSTAVFWSSLTSCFPGMLLTYFL